MSNPIAKAAVIGAGTMGSGIAAHLANAGLEVVLLDLEAEFAAAAVGRQLKAGGFMDPAFAKRVQTGSIVSDLAMVADADWIIEAVAERLDIKHDLFARLQTVRKPGSIISSNTSTIPLAALLAGMPEDFTRHFLITHFFNPPRRMRLLELVSGPMTSPEVAATIRDFADVRLGKGVVVAKDAPGFIANRIGVYWMAAAENEAIKLGLDVEEADALISAPFGIPPTGVFGLLDLVGIDLMPAILGSLRGALPDDDAVVEYAATPPLAAEMIRAGRTGRKAGAGFFRVSADRKTREALDLQTGEYRLQRPVSPETLAAAKGDPRLLMEQDGPAGAFASTVMEKTLSYAAGLIPQVADSPAEVDEAMRLGFGWKLGPFELMDRLGAAWLCERLRARGLPVSPLLAEAASADGFYKVVDNRRTSLAPGVGRRPILRPAGVFSLADLKLKAKPVEADAYASLWDMGDGAGLIELHTKLNTLSVGLLATLQRLLIRAGGDFRAVVIGGEAAHFSAGADVKGLMALAEGGGNALGEALEQGQSVFRWIKFAPYPVVSAVTGLALGGGCELALHSTAIQANAELTLGLVETNLGLIPGWGGCKEMLLRFSGADGGGAGSPAAALAAFELIRTARTAGNAFEARTMGFLRDTDGVTMNQDRLLADAKVRALVLADGYRAPAPRTLALSGAAGVSALRGVLDAARDAQTITAHDHAVGAALIGVLTGGPSADPAKPVSEDVIFSLEREAFLALFAMPLTQDRIRHMLATGKPLRT